MTRISRDTYGLKLAEAAALRADCSRRQVGAVIVSPDGSIVATGYNGLAAGRPGCASAGACPRGQMAYPSDPPVKVGDPDPTPFGSNVEDYNPPDWCGARRAEDSADGPSICTREEGHAEDWHIAGTGRDVWDVWPVAATHPADTGYEATGCRAVHAEVNAIIRAGRDRCIGATIYVTDEPCFHCSVVIEGAGLARVVTPTTEAAEALDITLLRDVPAPSAATSAPTEDDDLLPWGVPSSVGDADEAANGPIVPTVTGRGPLDPEIHAALVRAVERGRGEVGASNAGPALITDPAPFGSAPHERNY